METLYNEVLKRARGSNVITTNNKKVSIVVRTVQWGKKLLLAGSISCVMHFVFNILEDNIILT